MNWTEEEYNEYLKRKKEDKPQVSSKTERMTVEQYKEYLAKEKSEEKKRAKYNNKKVTVDGIVFSSKKEADYYNYLKIQLRIKEILRFELQPRFEVQEEYYKKNGKKVRKVEYIGDFKIWHLDGSVEVVDTKGYQTKEFRIKRKMFEKKYPDIKLSVI